LIAGAGSRNGSIDMSGRIEISRITGRSMGEIIPDLAHLRVRVFRDWPYLYDGTEEYEAAYLETYLRSETAAVIVARQEGRIVGASTCLKLVEETANVQAPFAARGWDPARFFYFGESVLLPELRGQGIGVRFFAEREAHARQISDCDYAAFCAVQRPEVHPDRPPEYQPLDRFWAARGFSRRPDLQCRMDWKDLGEAGETAKTLVFWLKSLTGAPLP
jgi:GNAT superfamily N-acetyltransferase